MKPTLRSLASPNPVTLTLATLLLFALFALHVPILELTEFKTYDLASGRAVRPSPAAVMAVVERSLDAEGRALPDRRLGSHVSREGARARVVAFDVAFAEPAAPEDDVALAAAIRRSPSSSATSSTGGAACTCTRMPIARRRHSRRAAHRSTSS